MKTYRRRDWGLALGMCLAHGWVVGRCCVLWTPAPVTTYLRDAVAAVTKKELP